MGCGSMGSSQMVQYKGKKENNVNNNIDQFMSFFFSRKDSKDQFLSGHVT
jgi:hypothetical protein